MAKHIKEYTIPDCPKCGRELERTMHYEGECFTGCKRYWRCSDCGYETEHLDSYAFWEAYPDAVMRERIDA